MTATGNQRPRSPTRQTPFKPAYAWYTVILLTLAYILSFVDRYMLGLLVEPIKADLHLSDTQIGLLLGPAFAIFYTTMGLPLGWLADRARRTWIVSAGILLWSLATAACGLARSFGQLFLARVGVGIGEATLSPCALSMIADSFPEERRCKPVAFYSAALSVGGGLASLAGASVLAWSSAGHEVSLPAFGVLTTWQLAFLIVAVAGVPLSLLMATLREPVRQSGLQLDGNQAAGLGIALRYVRSRWRAFAGFTAMVCVMTIVAYSQGWMPAMFQRTWGWPAEKYALWNGIVLLTFGPITVNAAGWLSDWLYRRGYRDAPLLIITAGLVILIPTGAIAPLMATGAAAFAVLVVNTIGIALVSAAGPTTLLNITPGEIRGQVIAMYYIAISLAGLLLGPTTIGVLTDQVFGTGGLRYAAALVPVLFGVPVLLTVFGTRRHYLAELNRLSPPK
ncbi:MAG: MFS transporter [Gammaproteobacteria bacterium]